MDSELTAEKRSIDLCFGVLVMLLNIGEIYLLSKIKKRKFYEMVLLSLSIADLLFGLSNAIVSAVYIADKAFEEIIESTLTTFFFFVSTSILHLSLIALDRLWAITNPIQHKIYVTKKKTITAITITWVIAFVISVTLIAYNELSEGFKRVERKVSPTNVANLTKGIQNQKPKKARMKVKGPGRGEYVIVDAYPTIMRTTLSALILVADLFFIIVNGLVVYRLQSSKMTNQQDHLKGSSSPNAEKTRDKASILCIFITLIFIVFTLPYPIYMFAMGKVSLGANLMLVLNSGMNSIVYFFRTRIEDLFSKRPKDINKNSVKKMMIFFFSVFNLKRSNGDSQSI